MTPQERLALALQYQQKLGDSLPSTPAENAARPVQAPTRTWLDALSDIGSGYGYQKAQDLEDLLQAAKHPLDTLHSMAVGVGKAMDNPVATAQSAWQGAKDFAGNAVSNPYNLGGAIASATSINPRKIAAALESPAVREIVAYHGTPHRFPATEASPLGEFDASKIGTGAGAQAYGHGVYLAESPDVAGGYIRTNPIDVEHLARTNGIGELSRDAQIELRRASNIVDKSPKDAAKIAQNASRELRSADQVKLAEVINTIREDSKGSLYHADLPDEMIDRMLDWHKRISDQPESVRAAWQSWQQTKEAQKLKKQLLARGSTQAEIDKMFANPTGETVHGWIYEGYGSLKGGEKPKVAKFLQSQGVLGVKYQDAGSPGQGGTGTRNFVVFPGEEKKVKILERK